MTGLIIPGQSTGSGLTYIEKDKEWQRVPITGRYDCERDEWLNPIHRKKVILSAWLIMAENQAKLDSIWTGETPQVRGPLAHIDFSEDSSPDEGPGANRPDPRDRDAMEAWEAADRRLAAKRAGLNEALVDFTIVAQFKRRVTGAFTVRLPDSR
jgi:hypothetical protein